MVPEFAEETEELLPYQLGGQSLDLLGYSFYRLTEAPSIWQNSSNLQNFDGYSAFNSYQSLSIMYLLLPLYNIII
jgi:hypothetical protein